MIAFDHIAIAAPTICEGVAYFQSLTNVEIPYGGEHPDMGTHNHLTSLGADAFLEVIAINPDSPSPNRARWFNLNHIIEPQVTWLLRTDDIKLCIAKADDLGIKLGEPLPLKRDDLRWRFTVRDDGTIPLGGTGPLILQWDSIGAHPASRMTDLGLRLDQITIQTPTPQKLHQLLDVLGLDDKPEITTSDISKVSITLTNSNGRKMTLP